jgi:pimeloyl-ACP methyl ester carboxylesterase
MSNYTEISFTSDDGLRLAARDYAAGAQAGAAPGHAAAAHLSAPLPVLCLHGLTRNAADFDEFAPRIAALGRRVLALDVRGRGGSAYDPEPDNYNPKVYANDVETLMNGLGIERAIFVGTSMGGLITMTLASRNIERVAAAVLNDIGPVISARGLARIAGYAGKVVRPATWAEAAAAVKEINRCAFPDNADDEWDRWARRAFAPDDDGRLRPRYDPNIAISLQNGKLRPSSLSARKAFRTLTGQRPTLLVRGALSDLVEARQADWMRRAAPSMDYVEVPNVGHAPMLTEPPAFDAIVRFLAQVV